MHLLRRWQRQIELRRRLNVVADQLTELADALARQQVSYSRADHRWLRNTAGTVLRLANRMPEKKSPLVAAQCDTILAAVTANEISTAAFVEQRIAIVNQRVTPVTDVEPADQVANASEPELPTAFAARPLVAADANASATSVAASDNDTSLPSPVPTDRSPVPEEEDQTNRFLKWVPPMLNWAPAMPIHAVPREREPSGVEAEAGDVKSPGGSLTLDPSHPSQSQGMVNSGKPAQRSKGSLRLDPSQASNDESVGDLESRELLARWLEADGRDVLPLEEEITRRGFGRLTARLVEQLFSDDVEQRLRLVDDVLTEPGVDARPWLLLLADDAEGDVRLLAVTIMATSDDGALIEKAWQVAIRDSDPRIAGLAGRLRARRETAQRR
jgi:hypothetical protein